MMQTALQMKETQKLCSIDPRFDWEKIIYLLQVSRTMDNIEETRLVPSKDVLYQFSARGHDVAQIMLGSLLTDKHDAICGYYRSRPILLSLGISLDDAMSGPLARSGGYSDGRDIGVVFNYPNKDGCSALPMCGGVGAQYTPSAGWAQAIEYHRNHLGNKEYENSIAVVLGGDASVGGGRAASLAAGGDAARALALNRLISVKSSYQNPCTIPKAASRLMWSRWKLMVLCGR